MKLSAVSIFLVGLFASTNAIDDIGGIYEAIDSDDGSRQLLTVLCDANNCDFRLSDTSFSTCKANVNGTEVITNGYATAVDVTNLASFKLKLACAPVPNANVVATAFELTGDLKIIEKGVIQRTVPGYIYYRTGNDKEVVEEGDKCRFFCWLRG
jgi:hypothetical protein